jgi:hypothetical protein
LHWTKGQYLPGWIIVSMPCTQRGVFVMFKFCSSLAAVLSVASVTWPGDVRAQSWPQVGMLRCTLAPSIGLIIASQQRMTCRFDPSVQYPSQNYEGVMTTIGLDVGITAGGRLVWGVYAPTVGPAFGGLAGTYVGASGEVTVGLGLGANVLLGGSARSVALQPLSVEGTAGLDLQLGVSDLQLLPIP